MRGPWYYFYSNGNSNYKNDTYYDSNSFIFSKILEDNYDIIYNEITSYITYNAQKLKPYFDKDLVNSPNKWKSFSFYFFGVRISKDAIKSCPMTLSLLNQIPGLISASVSVMEPNSEIKPHYGDTDAIYRCHFGIEIPSGLPQCGFRVGYEDRGWETGKLLVFNDAAYHKGWNYSQKRRIVLIFDIIRPEFRNKQNWICSLILGHMSFQIFIDFFSLKRKKNTITELITFVLAAFIYLRFLLGVNIKRNKLSF